MRRGATYDAWADGSPLSHVPTASSLLVIITFGPNFLWDASQKINTAGPAEVKNSGTLFVSNMVGFSTKLLEYHAHMEFRVFGVKNIRDSTNR